MVYLAEHLVLQRRVALKLLGRELSAESGFRDRFIRESRSAATLVHPNIVTVYDAGEAEGQLYISMEYIDGTDLEDVIRLEAPMSVSRVARVAELVAAALDAAHSKGLVHRDVKPGNILVAPSQVDRESIYLSDFGITKRSASLPRLTRSGEFVGTIGYIAPEQILGRPVDGRADEYSLACVLYECLTGEQPFERDNDVAVIYAHLHDPPPSVRRTRSGSSSALDAVLSRGMAKTPEERFPSCGAFALGFSHASGSLVPARSRRSRSTARRRLVAAGAVTIVAAAIAIGLVERPRASLVGNQPRASTAVLPSPRTTAGPSGLFWLAVPRSTSVFGGAGDQVMVRVTEIPAGLFAVGYRTSAAGGTDAAIWRSARGAKWKPVSFKELGGPGNQEARGVAEIAHRVVVVGSVKEAGALDAAVWIRNNGRAWRRLRPAAPLAGPGDQEMRRVIRAGRTLIAVGNRTGPSGVDVGIWVSRTGTRWTIPRGAQGLDSPGDQSARTIAVSGGVVVAAGSSVVQGNEDAAVWIRRRGVWSRSPSRWLGGPGAQHIDAVTAGGPGFIAVGSDGDQGTVWVSKDGVRWRRPIHVDPVVAGATSAEIFGVTKSDQGFTAVGSEVDDGDVNGAVWTSPYGITWTPVMKVRISALRDLGAQAVEDIAWYEGRLVAVGHTANGSGGNNKDAAVWITSMLP